MARRLSASISSKGRYTTLFKESRSTTFGYISTINGQTFKLFKKGTTTKIAAQVSYNADTDMAKLNPTNNLKRGITYKAVVSTGAKDVAGNRLDQDGSTPGLQQKVWFFTIDD